MSQENPVYETQIGRHTVQTFHVSRSRWTTKVLLDNGRPDRALVTRERASNQVSARKVHNKHVSRILDLQQINPDELIG